MAPNAFEERRHFSPDSQLFPLSGCFLGWVGYSKVAFFFFVSGFFSFLFVLYQWLSLFYIFFFVFFFFKAPRSAGTFLRCEGDSFQNPRNSREFAAEP